jgi:nucleoside-diphosphate-sugar epimerase
MIKKNMIIYGATGFIGKNLTHFFSQNTKYNVTATYNQRPPFECPNITWLKVNLLNHNEVKESLKNQQIVIQAAATTSGAKDIVNSPALHVTDNAVMNSLLFREVFELKIEKCVFFSCTVMYKNGSIPLKEEDFSEDEIHQRYFGVGWTKVYMEKMAEFYAHLGTTKFIVLRHSNIYGPHDKFDLDKGHVFAANLLKIKKALYEKKQSLTVWGDGSDVRDFLHMKDLADFVEICLESDHLEKFNLFNVGSEAPISVKSLIDLMIKVIGVDLIAEWDTSKPSIGTSIIIDCSKARALDWSAKIKLKDGIKDAWIWLNQNVSI